jgi:hypothetical protein
MVPSRFERLIAVVRKDRGAIAAKLTLRHGPPG